MPTYTLDTTVAAPKYEPLGRVVAACHNVIGMATGDLVLNATFDICRLPRGAKVVDIVLAVTDMDSATTGTIHVGDAADPDRFIVSGSIQAAGVLRAGNAAGSAATLAAHTAYTGETLIYGTVAAAPTAVAGTISATVFYVVET